MVEDKIIMPRGPWVTDEEMEAILATDADKEFERMCRLRSRRTLWMRRAVVSLAAASMAGLAFLLWPTGNDNEAVACIYGNKVENEQVAIDMMNATLAEVLSPESPIENELSNILNAK